MPVVKRLLVALAALALITLGAAYTALYSTRAGREASRSNGPSAPALIRKLTTQRPEAVGPGWKLTFDASFAGTKLDASVWATCYPWLNSAVGCTNFGNNDEKEWYLPSQVRVSAGVLNLAAQRIPTPGYNRQGAPKEYFCRSGMVTSYPGFHFEYGYLQIVARVPQGTGLWPALWLMAVDDQWPPEIDILEEHGASGAAVYFHPVGAPSFGTHPAAANLSVGWHTFGLDWTPSGLAWFIDGGEVMSTSQHIPHMPMYLIANLADYMRPASGGCDGALLIKSVKLWQP